MWGLYKRNQTKILNGQIRGILCRVIGCLCLFIYFWFPTFHNSIKQRQRTFSSPKKKKEKRQWDQTISNAVAQISKLNCQRVSPLKKGRTSIERDPSSSPFEFQIISQLLYSLLSFLLNFYFYTIIFNTII